MVLSQLLGQRVRSLRLQNRSGVLHARLSELNHCTGFENFSIRFRSPTSSSSSCEKASNSSADFSPGKSSQNDNSLGRGAPSANGEVKTSAASLKGHSIPPIAQVLGYGGLIPFVTGAVIAACSTTEHFIALHATQLYGASILSFLGATHWGVALAENAASSRLLRRGSASDALTDGAKFDLVYGVVPSLIGWSAAMLDPYQGIAVLIPGFIGAYGYDYRRFTIEAPASVPTWYMRLRKRLTVGACLSLAACLGISVHFQRSGIFEQNYMTAQAGSNLDDLIVNV